MFSHNYKQIIRYMEERKRTDMSKETIKTDKVITLLLSDMTPEEITHVIINKMTLPAKRQLISEILNKEGAAYEIRGQNGK